MRPKMDVADLVGLDVHDEKAGIDGVMASDHIVLGPSANALGLAANPRDYALPGNQDPWTPWPSPLVLLSAVAAATTSLRLVAGAVITPLRHPLALAKDLATLDRLSDARLVVLPTVSWHRDEYAALGVSFERRGDMLDEQLEIFSRVFDGSPSSFEGEFYRFDDVWLEPQPRRQGGPLLWFGGSSVHRRLISRLVRYGSGFNPLGSPSDDELGRLAAALTAGGRSTAEIEYVGGARGIFRDSSSTADLAEAVARIPRQLARGFRTICVKPSQFIDEVAEIPDFCHELVTLVNDLGE
jgi:alkanesulfonate monooxygenase SsuD/methylene tetrahydromethanopterin reductase-like flavin-dependent oxidoreductase (luciferase family)